MLAVLAALIIGPDRIPEYAQQLGRLVRELRRMATGARAQLRDEMGPEIDNVDWRKLDPRQYDPRRIIKEALLEEDEEPQKPVSRDAPQAAPQRSSGPRIVRLDQGESAPFDVEAT